MRYIISVANNNKNTKEKRKQGRKMIVVSSINGALVVNLSGVRVNAQYRQQLAAQGYALHSIHKDVFGRYGFVRAI